MRARDLLGAALHLLNTEPNANLGSWPARGVSAAYKSRSYNIVSRATVTRQADFALKLLTVKEITDEDSVTADHARNREIITCKLLLGLQE
jgi:hypothetical protein